MNLFKTMAEKIKNGIQTWLRIQPAQISSIQLQEVLNYDGNAIKNRIWYRGDSEELSQLYKQVRVIGQNFGQQYQPEGWKSGKYMLGYRE